MFDWMNVNRSFLELDQFRREMDRLFGQTVRNELSGTEFSEIGRETGARFRTNENSFVLSVDLPGVKPADIDLQVTRDGITVRAERKLDAPSGYSTHRQERGSWKFSRSWTLPLPIDPDKALAEVKDGVLVVTMPKAADVTPRRIDVKA
jgi:HSP20 family protein